MKINKTLYLFLAFFCFISCEPVYSRAPEYCSLAHSEYKKNNDFNELNALTKHAYDNTLKEKSMVVADCLRHFYSNAQIYSLLDELSKSDNIFATKIFAYFLITGTYFKKDTDKGLALLRKASLSDDEAKKTLTIFKKYVDDKDQEIKIKNHKEKINGVRLD